MNTPPPIDISPQRLEAFVAVVRREGSARYRDLPWRNTRDSYEVLVSEVMLQQTQVARVLDKWPSWLERFPTVDALAAAPVAAVLEEWRGLGYNRRALALKHAAERCSEVHAGALPCGLLELLALPGVGPATAAGVRAFAWNLPGVYLETNVRTVLIHELMDDRVGVSDRELIPILEAACDGEDPRGWYYALLDYGAHLKKTVPNPSRRSRHHARQSAFEGSNRQKRSWLLRAVMDDPGRTAGELAGGLSEAERAAGRDPLPQPEVERILCSLRDEGFLSEADGRWHVV